MSKFIFQNFISGVFLKGGWLQVVSVALKVEYMAFIDAKTQFPPTLNNCISLISQQEVQHNFEYILIPIQITIKGVQSTYQFVKSDPIQHNLNRASWVGFQELMSQARCRLANSQLRLTRSNPPIFSIYNMVLLFNQYMV